jgi:hypothetical protein
MRIFRYVIIALIASCAFARAQLYGPAPQGPYQSGCGPRDGNCELQARERDRIQQESQARERHNQSVLENRELARRQQLADEVTAVNDLVNWANDTVQPRLAASFTKCKSVVAAYQDFVVGKLTAAGQQSPSKAGQQKIIDAVSLLQATSTDNLACTKQILLSLGIDNHPSSLAAQTAKNIFSDFTDTGLKQFSDRISLSFMDNEDPNKALSEMSCLVIKEWSWVPDYADADNGPHCHGRLEDLLRRALHGEGG